MRWGATQGDDFPDAMQMAADALGTALAFLISRNEDLPRPSARRGANYHTVSLPPLQSAKIALYLAFRESGLRKTELARRIGIPKTNVDRLFDLRHASRLDQIDAALHALGKRLVVSVQDAA
jgi:antitoxin HicB